MLNSGDESSMLLMEKRLEGGFRYVSRSWKKSQCEIEGSETRNRIIYLRDQALAGQMNNPEQIEAIGHLLNMMLESYFIRRIEY